MVNINNQFSQALSSLYTASCDIYHFLSFTDPITSITSQSLELLHQSIPCRVSYLSSSSSASTKKNDFSYVNSSPIKIFLQCDLTINSGSIFYVTNYSKTLVYKASSEPFIYSSHQEVIIAPFDDIYS